VPRGGAAGAFPPPIARLGAPEPHDDSRESPLASAGMANSTIAPESSIEKRERMEKLKKSLQNPGISVACFTGGSAVFGPLPYLGGGGGEGGGEKVGGQEEETGGRKPEEESQGSLRHVRHYHGYSIRAERLLHQSCKVSSSGVVRN
jgi:hypothetical protein